MVGWLAVAAGTYGAEDGSLPVADVVSHHSGFDLLRFLGRLEREKLEHGWSGVEWSGVECSVVFAYFFHGILQLFELLHDAAVVHLY